MLMILLGLAMVIAPFFFELAIMTRLLLTMVGMLTTVFGLNLVLINQWYRKASADEAIVRTGSGGTKVVIDGGILVLSFLHKMIRVPLKARKIAFDLAGSDGLVTKDKQTFDVHSEFYVRVGATPEQVEKASRLFGEQSSSDNVFEDMVRVKLINALRSVAGKYDQAVLSSDGEAFAASVKELVVKEIEPDGLVLETTAISKMPIIGI